MSTRVDTYEPAVGDEVEVVIRGRVTKVAPHVALVQRTDGEVQWLDLVDARQLPTGAVTWRPTSKER